MNKAKEFIKIMEQGERGKVLRFEYARKYYEVSLEPETLGHFIRSGERRFSLPNPDWVMLGVSKHHWSSQVDVKLTSDIDPKSLIGGIVWDVDHGTTRRWGGRYDGKMPRITRAWIIYPN